jgi:hypothetical protein
MNAGIDFDSTLFDTMTVASVMFTEGMKTALRIPRETNVTVFANGYVQIDNEDPTLGYEFGPLSVIRLASVEHEVHKLIYVGFHRNSAELFKDNKADIVVRNIFRDGTNRYRNHVEDLKLYMPHDHPEPHIIQHPVYNRPIHYGIPMTMYVKKDGYNIPVPQYRVTFFNNHTNCVSIRRITSDRPISTAGPNVVICFENYKRTYDIHIIIASTAFPDIQPGESVNHINRNYSDNRVSNLEWMSMKENCRDGQAKSCEKFRNGTPVSMFDERDGTHVEIRRFSSTFAAARLIYKLRASYASATGTVLDPEERDEEHAVQEGIPLTTPMDEEEESDQKLYELYRFDDAAKDRINSIASKITRGFKNPTYRPYNYIWRISEQPDLRGEVWKRVPTEIVHCVEGYMVSNYGRVKNLRDVHSRQRPNRHGKYSSVGLTIAKNVTKSFYVHYLVWWAFKNRHPEGEILHDDRAPLRGGKYRNYLEDLSEGTRSQNMKGFHEAIHFGPNEEEILDVDAFKPDTCKLMFEREKKDVTDDLPNDYIKELMINRKNYHNMQYNEARPEKTGDKFVNRGSCYSFPPTVPFATPGSKSEIKGPQIGKYSNRVKFLHALRCSLTFKEDKTIDMARAIACLTAKEREHYEMICTSKNRFNEAMKGKTERV